jgi:hypothetical protein
VVAAAATHAEAEAEARNEAALVLSECVPF